MACKGSLIQESDRSALALLHKILLEQGYVRADAVPGLETYVAYRPDSTLSKPRSSPPHPKVILDSQRRTVGWKGGEALLTPKEFGLLERLARHPEQVLTRDVILGTIFEYAFLPSSDIVSTCVSTLRSKLKRIGLHDVVETVRGTGYRLSQNHRNRLMIIP